MHYLNQIRLLDEEKQLIWDTLSERDLSHTLRTISRICHIQSSHTMSPQDIIAPLKRQKKTIQETSTIHKEKSSNRPLLIETSGDLQTEIQLIKD